jgi:predicted DNA-binding transcriptional regulator YafY
MDRVERLTNLLALLLETNRPLSLVEIAGEMGGQYPERLTALRAAFERDKAALRDIGVPIETEVRTGGVDAGATAYWIDRNRYELSGLELAADETRALQLAFAAVRSGSGAGITAGEEALWKLGTERVDAGLAVTAHVPELPVLPVLRDATARRVAVSFRYRGRSRTIDPYGLLLRNGFWYVLGHDHGHDELRTYRVDRVEGEVAIAGAAGSFQRPEGFDPRAVFPSEAKHFGIVDDEAVTARVRISKDRAIIVERELGSDRVVRRGKRGWIDIDVPFANPGAFGSWVLGLVDHAEVLSPPEARAAIRERLQAIVDRGTRRRASRSRR